MTLRIERLTGDGLRAAVADVARLRMAVFRDWPYLYDGSEEYEQQYLARFAAADSAVVVAACDGPQIVGAATAAPMTGHADEFAAPFLEHGYDLDHIFYFGESVLLPKYRGRGIGHAFFDHREAHARAIGRFTQATFCAVVRPDNHPLKPPDYRPLDAFWQKRGYRRIEGLRTSFEWKDLDQPGATAKLMQFWMKAL